jgi:hypothetical protein
MVMITGSTHMFQDMEMTNTVPMERSLHQMRKGDVLSMSSMTCSSFYVLPVGTWNNKKIVQLDGWLSIKGPTTTQSRFPFMPLCKQKKK